MLRIYCNIYCTLKRLKFVRQYDIFCLNLRIKVIFYFFVSVNFLSSSGFKETFKYYLQIIFNRNLKGAQTVRFLHVHLIYIRCIYYFLMFLLDNLLFRWSADYLFPANIYLFKVNNRNTRKRCEICSKLTIKTPERRHWHHF